MSTQNIPPTDGERFRYRVKKWRAGGDAAPCGLPLAFGFYRPLTVVEKPTSRGSIEEQDQRETQKARAFHSVPVDS